MGFVLFVCIANRLVYWYDKKVEIVGLKVKEGKMVLNLTAQLAYLLEQNLA